MKKILLAAALIFLVAAGCNKAVSEQQNSSEDQQQNQNQGIAVGEPNPNGSGSGDVVTPPKDDRQEAPHYSDGSDIEVAPTPEVLEVKISANGFSPATLKIKKGDYVQFTNGDTTATHWPASDPHPQHGGYPGFDANKGLKAGENYRFQFEKTGTWGYHDHLHPALRGTIVVE